MFRTKQMSFSESGITYLANWQKRQVNRLKGYVFFSIFSCIFSSLAHIISTYVGACIITKHIGVHEGPT